MSDIHNLTGTVIENRFKILESLGRGGMATVYRAAHVSVDLQVAIKVLDQVDAPTEADIERMKREAQMLNSLFHPNIVKVYSFGFLESGNPYIILDFLNGKNLDDLIFPGPLPEVNWLLEVFLQICSGLEYAHANGLIHRDLKPSNVMIVDREPDGIFVKVLDFGIAKFASLEKEKQRLTQKGEVFGSPYYMSPEQIAEGTLTKISDIYSLGCLMYESLSGRPPFEGDTLYQTMVQHVTQSPKPPSHVDPERGISKELDSIILKCLEKKPAARYQSVEELKAALEKCLTQA